MADRDGNEVNRKRESFCFKSRSRRCRVACSRRCHSHSWGFIYLPWRPTKVLRFYCWLLLLHRIRDPCSQPAWPAKTLGSRWPKPLERTGDRVTRIRAIITITLAKRRGIMGESGLKLLALPAIRIHPGRDTIYQLVPNSLHKAFYSQKS